MFDFSFLQLILDFFADNWVNIVSSSISVISGAIVAFLLTYFLGTFKNRKKEKGVKTIIKSEIYSNLDELAGFYVLYDLKEPIKFKDKLSDGEKKLLDKVYDNIDDFPKPSMENWDKLIEFVPDLFNSEDIDLILEFKKDLLELYSFIQKNKDNRPHFYAQHISSEPVYLRSPKHEITFRNVIKTRIENIFKFQPKLDDIFNIKKD